MVSEVRMRIQGNESLSSVAADGIEKAIMDDEG